MPSTSIPTAHGALLPRRGPNGAWPSALWEQSREPRAAGAAHWEPKAASASGRGLPLSPAALKPPLSSSAAAKTRAQMSHAGRPGRGAEPSFTLLSQTPRPERLHRAELPPSARPVPTIRSAGRPLRARRPSAAAPLPPSGDVRLAQPISTEAGCLADNPRGRSPKTAPKAHCAAPRQG